MKCFCPNVLESEVKDGIHYCGGEVDFSKMIKKKKKEVKK